MEIRQLPGRYRGAGLTYLISTHVTPENQSVTELMASILRSEEPAINPLQLSDNCRNNLRRRIDKRLQAIETPSLVVTLENAPNTLTPTRYVRKNEFR